MSASPGGAARTEAPAFARKRMLAVSANLLAATACAWLLGRAALADMESYGTANAFLVALLLLAEAFILFHSLSYATALLASGSAGAPPRRELRDEAEAPDVAILLPARHEPRQVLEKTLSCLASLDYRNKTVYFLDDSSEPSYMKEAEELARAHGAVLFRRAQRHGAKAGILNDCLRVLKEKYVAIFDADQRPMPGFLKATIPLLEADERLAFVQTPQFYSNISDSPVAYAANVQHCMFYEYVCEGKEARGATTCCGTNVVLRRQALVEVGGFDEGSVTEDFATSVEFHLRGWESLYHGQVGTFGEGPTDLTAYLRQQWRWSRGNLGVLRKLLFYLLTRPWRMSLGQWWEHLATASFYLIGWAYLILMLCPVSFVFFGAPSLFAKPEAYLLVFVPCFSLLLTIWYASAQRRHYRAARLFSTLLLGLVALPVYAGAAVAAFINLGTGFGITPKAAASRDSSWWVFWPQVALWLLNFAAIVWAANELLIVPDAAIAMNAFWALFHFALLSGAFFFRRPAAAAAAPP